jgi:hypothetical protein
MSKARRARPRGGGRESRRVRGSDIDPGVDEALNEYIARRKAEQPDTHY